jgi:hypothetical protein
MPAMQHQLYVCVFVRPVRSVRWLRVPRCRVGDPETHSPLAGRKFASGGGEKKINMRACNIKFLPRNEMFS